MPKLNEKHCLTSLLLLILFLAAIEVFVPFTPCASASPETTIAVDPEHTVADPPENFTVDVVIAGIPNGVPNVFSYETKLGFDGAVLEATGVEEGPYIKDQTTSPMGTYFESKIDREAKGKMNYAYAFCLTVGGGYSGVTGGGILFTVTFTVKAAGETALTLYNTIIVDDTGGTYNATAEGDIVEFDGDFHTTVPVASFVFTPDTYGRPMPGENVTFDASASYDPDGGPIVSHTWDFGDGTNGTGMITTHIYDNVTSSDPDEPNQVTLTIVDDDGATNTGSEDVHVKLHDIAILEIVVAPLEVLLGNVVTINATVLNNGTHPELFNVTIYRNDTPIHTQTVTDLIPGNDTLTFEWDTEVLREFWNITKIRSASYQIWAYACLVEPLRGLKYISRPGEDDDISDHILFGDPVTVTQTPNPEIAVVNVDVDPTEVALGRASAVEVEIENQGNTDEVIDIFVYANSTGVANQTELEITAGATRDLSFSWYTATNTTVEGFYNVTVYVPPVANETDIGNNQQNVTVLMRLLPTPTFTFSPSRPHLKEEVAFDASASAAPGQPGGNITAYLWDFGDGTNGTGVTVTHVYDTPNEDGYSVKLTVADDQSLNSTRTEEIAVWRLPSETTIAIANSTIPVNLNTTISGSILPPRETVTVTLVYRNVTSADEGNWTVLDWVSTDENGQYTSIWMQTEAGDYQIQASWPGDATTLPAESPVLNVTVSIQDIALIAIQLPAIKATPGDLLTIDVVALNKGTATETFKLEVSYNDTLLVNAATVPLAAGSSGTISIPWDTNGLEEGIYTLRAVAKLLPGETYEADNSITAGLYLQESRGSSSSIFFYTTIGLAILSAALMFYFLKSKRSRLW